MRITTASMTFLACVLLPTCTWLSLLLLNLQGGHFLRMLGTISGLFVCVWSLIQIHRRFRESDDTVAKPSTGTIPLKQWGWKSSLCGTTVGAVISVVSWWIVPESESQLSLRSASVLHRQVVSDLTESNAESTADFVNASGQRTELCQAFPQFGESIQTAEREWLERAVALAIRQSRALLDRRPMGACETLSEFAGDLTAPLHAHSELEQQLLDARHGAYAAAFGQIREESRSLLLGDRFAEAYEVVNKRAARLSDEARSLGKSGELTQLVETYAYISEVAELARDATVQKEL